MELLKEKDFDTQCFFCKENPRHATIKPKKPLPDLISPIKLVSL